jgi:hypothetical protein
MFIGIASTTTREARNFAVQSYAFLTRLQPLQPQASEGHLFHFLTVFKDLVDRVQRFRVAPELLNQPRFDGFLGKRCLDIAGFAPQNAFFGVQIFNVVILHELKDGIRQHLLCAFTFTDSYLQTLDACVDLAPRLDLVLELFQQRFIDSVLLIPSIGCSVHDGVDELVVHLALNEIANHLIAVVHGIQGTV